VTSLRLLPEENVQWIRRKGLFSLSFGLAFVAVIGAFFLTPIGFLGAEVNGNPFPPNLALGWLGFALLLVGIGYMVAFLVLAKATRYILTNCRIAETRFDKIVEEIKLADFMDKPISQFFDKHAAGMVNQQPVYNCRITNPKSLNVIEFKSLSETATQALERILDRARQVVRCEYCNTNNSATSFVCSQCGAPLQ
jgi:hypothetical protein